jgi:hypothetical protein
MNQLNELEEFRSELEEEEYNSIKKSTAEDLEIFQQKLLEIESGDTSSLNAEIK